MVLDSSLSQILVFGDSITGILITESSKKAAVCNSLTQYRLTHGRDISRKAAFNRAVWSHTTY